MRKRSARNVRKRKLHTHEDLSPRSAGSGFVVRLT